MVRVALCQFETGSTMTSGEKRRLSRLGADFIALPEYFFAPQEGGSQRNLASRATECLEFLASLSLETGAAVVGGTIVEPKDGTLFNTCPLFDRGREIARYRKRHPTPGELQAGITPGREAVVAETRGVKVAPLICADVLHPGCFEEAGRLGARILFTPVVSPHRPDDTPARKAERDRSIFQSGARRAGAFVVKTAAPGRVFGNPLQGRSLVAAPWGILARATPGPGALSSPPPGTEAELDRH
jgi:predicted amidohydrolase